jgi:hypothetical protein
MRLLKRPFIIVTCSIIAVLILPWFICPFINNIKLFCLTRQLTGYELPSKTQMIENRSICGKLNGNGNGMDFLATILIKSDLSIGELQKYYSFAEVIPQKCTNLKSEYLEHGEIKYTKLQHVKAYNNYFVVLIYYDGYPALFDLRGN